MPRYLAIDYGRRRLGLAISDADGKLALPLKQLDGRGSPQADADQLKPIVEDYDIEALVVGLPLNMDGSRGPQAELSVRFADVLTQRLGLPVDLWDERLSSHAADRLLDQRDNLTSNKRKARRDALAAQTFLQCFLDSRRASGR